MQRTFSIIKPDATKRDITGSINKIIEDNFIDSSARMQKEESNLLYVALTRAKKILIINGFQKKKDCWFNNLSSS